MNREGVAAQVDALFEASDERLYAFLSCWLDFIRQTDIIEPSNTPPGCNPAAEAAFSCPDESLSD